MPLKLRSVQRESRLPMRVATMITRQILDGHINPGDRLPTEQVLARSLGVSRNVVREAVARLQSEGILQARHGIGVFVLDTPNIAIPPSAGEMQSDMEAIRSLMELRRIIEPQAAMFAAMRRSDDDLKAIGSALASMGAADGWDKATVDADLSFHMAIAASAKNQHLVDIYHSMASLMREGIVMTRGQDAPDVEARNAYTEHERIFAAIEGGDSALASREMDRHILLAARRLSFDMSYSRRLDGAEHAASIDSVGAHAG